MPATNQDLKDFFALSGNNPAVTDGQLLDLQDWLNQRLGITGSTANDLVDEIYQVLKDAVLKHKRREFTPTF